MNRYATISLLLVLCVSVGEVRSHEFTFSGHVTKPDGSPAAGARVYLASQMRNEFLEPPVSVRCEADGAFSGLTTHVHRTATIHAVSADRTWQSIVFIPFSAARTYASKPVEIILKPADRVAVRVLNAGEPVSECQVIVDGLIGSGVVTNKSGEVTLLYPAVSYWHKRVVAFHKDHGLVGWRSQTRTDPLPKSLELSLEPKAERTFRTVDRLDQPVPQLHLALTASSDDWSAPLVSIPESWTRTDGQGVARVAWFPKRSKRIGVRPLSAEWDWESTKSEADNSSTTVRLKKMHLFQGRVRFPDGRPRAGVGVVASGTNETRSSTSWARTDAAGLFRLHVAADHVYVVGVQDSEWTSDLRDGVLLRTVGDEVKYEQRGTFLSARAATPLVVTVHDRDNEPVANAWVYSRFGQRVQWVNQAGENEKSQVSFKGWRLADSNGLATFAVGPGTHEMRVSTPKWSLTKKIEVVEGKPAKLTIQQPE